MKVLLIAGHGQGDSGAVGNGYTEADKTRELSKLVYDLLVNEIEVTLYDQSKNCYKQCKSGNAPNWKEFDLVVEFHFNAFNGLAKGVEVLVPHTGIKQAADIVDAIAKYGFINRGIKVRDNLLNMNLCTNANVDYILIETCFIDNAMDMRLYEGSRNQIANSIAYNIIDERLNPTTTLYKVQCGAFNNMENALELSERLTNDGYDNFVTNEDGLYKVQTGAYRITENAYNKAYELKEKGYDVYVRVY